jgi:glycosyltransferase involved in cell wall biosynthesis
VTAGAPGGPDRTGESPGPGPGPGPDGPGLAADPDPDPDFGGVRIAVVNWRDPWHPEAGGAERYAWAMAGGLARRGAAVSFLTARARGQARRDRRDGIEIIRLGGRFTVYPLLLGWLLAHRWLARSPRAHSPRAGGRSFAAVLDCQNGIPFFTPLVLPAAVPVLCVMHHVHSVQWSVHFPGWVARLGRLLEGPLARAVYRHHACVAVSPSTVAAMREELRWPGDIYLIPNGAEAPLRTGEPAADPAALVWLGRLVAHKRADLLLPIAERLSGAGLTIDVVGRGPASAALAAGVAARGLAGQVRLRGYLPEPAKQAVLAGARLHLNTSLGEGWGLCVLEAAALGVPTVAFDVPGLRDAVRDGQTGWLVRDGERIEDVTQRAVKELDDPVRRAEVAAACRAWAAELSWDTATARMAALLDACLRRGTSRAGHPGTWIVSTPDGGARLAEGPVLDILIGDGSAVPRRPATPLERLLGRPIPEPGPAQ